MKVNSILYILFIYLFVVDYFVLRVRVLPKIVSLTPEIFSGIVLLIVCMLFVKYRVLNIPVKYVILFAFFILFLLVGVLLNQVQAGAFFSGIRKYFRYAPFFILPLVYYFSDKEIGKLINLLLLFTLIQLPVAIYQKLVLFKANPTGDVIQGTVIGSGHLALYLICAISFALAYYLKGRIKLNKTLIIILIFFLPIGITEASAAFFLLPIVFIVPIFFMPKERTQFNKLMPLIMMGVVFFAGFIVIYNAQYSDRWGGNILNAVVKGQVFEKVYKQPDRDRLGQGPGTARLAEISRIDAPILALENLAEKGLVSVLVGVGIGNASRSFSDQLKGEYFFTIDEYNSNVTTISNMFWEIGILGVGFSYVLLLMVFFDAFKLRFSKDRIGAIALGWLGVIVIIAISMGYTNLLAHNVMGYLMWFFLGLIISNASNNQYNRYQH